MEQRPYSFVAHGKGMLSASDQGIVRYWNLSDLENIPPPTQFTYHAGFRIFRLSPLVDRFVTAVTKGPITLWNPIIGEKVREFSPADEIGIAADDSRGTNLQEFTAPDLREIYQLPNDQGYAVWLEEGHLQIWNQDFESVRWKLHEPDRHFDSVAFSFDGKLIAVPGEKSDQSVRVLSTVDGSLVHEMPIDRHLWMGGLRFALDSYRLSIQTLMKTYFLDPNTGRTIEEATNPDTLEKIYLVGDRRFYVDEETTTIKPLVFGGEESDVAASARDQLGYAFDGAKMAPVAIGQ